MATEVESPLTGNVWKIEKTVGAVVQEGDVIIILESMKMEIPIEAPVDGSISEMKVKEGDAIEEGAVVAVIV